MESDMQLRNIEAGFVNQGHTNLQVKNSALPYDPNHDARSTEGSMTAATGDSQKEI